MSILSLLAVVLDLGFYLGLAAVQVDREGRRVPDRSDRDTAMPIPIPVDRSGTRRPKGEVNPPATLRFA